MNIDTRKLAFIQRFTQLKDENTLKKFEDLLELENQFFQPMSVEEYRNHVKEGIEDYHSGRTTDHKDFENEIKSWK
jgi:hypothetical protein